MFARVPWITLMVVCATLALVLGGPGCDEDAAVTAAADAAAAVAVADAAVVADAVVADAGATAAVADGGSKPSARRDAATAAPATGAGASSGAADAGEPAPDASTAASDRAQAISLRFRALFGDEPFACGESFVVQDGEHTVSPRDLRLFVQDVVLIDETGQEVPLLLDERPPWQTAEVALLDFEDASGECFGDEGENHEITGTVPPGKYTGLRFSNGVPETLNHSDPKTYPAPLQTPGMSWSWLLGFRFVKFETITLDVPDQGADAGFIPGGFGLHVGSVGCAGSQNEGTIRCAKPNRNRVQIDDFDPDTNEIVLDLSELLGDSDLSQLVECHSASEPCDAMFRALGIDYATGQPGAGASAYRALP